MTGFIVTVLVFATVSAVRAAARATWSTRTHRRLDAVGEPPPRRLERVRPPAPVERRLAASLDRADLSLAVGRVWHAWLVTAVCGAGVAAALGGVAFAVLVVVAVAALPPAALWLLRDRADRRCEATLPALLEDVARGLRSGAGAVQALTSAASNAPGRLGADLRSAVACGRDGSLQAALDGWAAARPLPGVRLAVAALALGAETGGAQAQAIDGVATTLRDRLAVAAEARALASQARMSAAVIAAAPIGFAALAAVTDPRQARFLVRTPAGLACLALGLALDGVAVVWMARLTRTAT